MEEDLSKPLVKTEASCSYTRKFRQAKENKVYHIKDEEEDEEEDITVVNDMGADEKDYIVVPSSEEEDSDWEIPKPVKATKAKGSRKRKSDDMEKEPTEPKVKRQRKAPAAKKPPKEKAKPKAPKEKAKPKTTKAKQPKVPKQSTINVDVAQESFPDNSIMNSVQGDVKPDYQVESGIPCNFMLHVIKQETKSSLSACVKQVPNGSEFTDIPCERLWQNEDVISEATGVQKNIIKNIITLLDQDCTVPFIARYRKEKTGHLSPEKIREVELAYDSVKSVHKRVDTIMKTLSKTANVDPLVIRALQNAKTLEEVEYLYAPLKPGSKRSLAERAKQLGLEPYALDLLGKRKRIMDINFDSIVDPNTPGKSNKEEIMKGIQNIIADIVSKDMEVLDLIRNHHAKKSITFVCKHSPTAVKEEKKAFVEGKENKNYKFENYFDFSNAIRNINSHQILAMNRGEREKVLNIKLVVPNFIKHDVKQVCWRRVGPGYIDPETSSFLGCCIDDAYDRLLEPLMCRQIRSELTKKAAQESVDVFCQNLKRLLLTPPVRGKTVLGIDPGFKHGCKLAVVSSKGEVLGLDVMYLPHPAKLNNNNQAAEKIVNLVSTFAVSIVAIGNGTACRETESFLSSLIERNAFQPNKVRYCIIDESGASIYSVTKEAEAELPGMDPNLRSAVCIARRLQDPLLEYVKVEPKHLGVGMYQHDINENMLKTALNGVVVECVSFVGVDLNVCPEVILQKISGLSSARAKQIIQWREANGCFVSRQQLLEVKGLGPKSFEQCAGFVKIFPQTSVDSRVIVPPVEVKGKKKKAEKDYKPDLLDTTVIHPESYDVARKFLGELKADVDEIGKQSLVNKVQNYMRFTSAESIAERIGASVEQMQLIIGAFKQLMDYDIRSEFEVPLFRSGVRSIADLQTNQKLTGRVTNVTHFGAFVDIGVGQSGLIHVSKMRSRKVQLGDRVTVKVLSVDIPKKRIGLELLLD